MTARTATRSRRSTLKTAAGRCGGCGKRLRHTVADLGMHPLSARLIPSAAAGETESFYPLRVVVCDRCWLVQRSPAPTLSADATTVDDEPGEAPPEWRAANASRETAQLVQRFGLDAGSLVVQLGSNDGYLLRHFLARDIPVQGIESSPRLAAAANERGAATLAERFTASLASELQGSGRQADLLIAHDVLSLAWDLSDLLEGIARLLRPRGVAVLEFPDLLRILEGNQFDVIDHRRTYYHSLTAARMVLERHGLRIFDAEESPALGGTLRIYVCRDGERARTPTSTVARLLQREQARGLESLETYAAFEQRTRAAKREILAFLLEAKRLGRQIVAYGAVGSAPTLLNYCGMRADLIDYAVDRSEEAEGGLTPGTRIPVAATSKLRETEPDFVLILPRDRQDEIMSQHEYISDWGGRFVIPIPALRIYS